MNKTILECRSLSKSFNEGQYSVDVLDGVNFKVEAGQKIAIVGASGSGKSTFLNMLGGLDTPSSGEVIIQGQKFSSLSDRARGEIRNKYLGFVYQFHHLLPEFTAEENVLMPLRIAGMPVKEGVIRAREYLERVGLSHRVDHKPSALSGGERQRVAIARALVNRPACVLLDEPTGNLDRNNAQKIHALIEELSGELETAFVVVTHDEHYAQTLDSIYQLVDGDVVAVERNTLAESRLGL